MDVILKSLINPWLELNMIIDIITKKLSGNNMHSVSFQALSGGDSRDWSL